MPISLPDVWYVEHLKLVGYLLNLDHPVGHAKARAFLGYGFTEEDPKALATALFDHADSSPYRLVQVTHGIRFVFEGPMQAPRGIIPLLRSVWLADDDDRSVRLLTAYPFDEH